MSQRLLCVLFSCFLFPGRAGRVHVNLLLLLGFQTVGPSPSRQRVNEQQFAAKTKQKKCQKGRPLAAIFCTSFVTIGRVLSVLSQLAVLAMRTRRQHNYDI